ncbi:hypothetical protein PsorP6_010687 [Peronosclerospora sorghi]|uniref:Uncharacterized protein n=1 Tax=Peronosclerospora sorghi TaxID=230839 RepID=A0ACC0VVG0_9STRA|nr:hypothetical protein PsorP6_010687 [Peronosclerospora sorghi]
MTRTSAKENDHFIRVVNSVKQLNLAGPSLPVRQLRRGNVPSRGRQEGGSQVPQVPPGPLEGSRKGQAID